MVRPSFRVSEPSSRIFLTVTTSPFFRRPGVKLARTSSFSPGAMARGRGSPTSKPLFFCGSKKDREPSRRSTISPHGSLETTEPGAVFMKGEDITHLIFAGTMVVGTINHLGLTIICLFCGANPHPKNHSRDNRQDQTPRNEVDVGNGSRATHCPKHKERGHAAKNHNKSQHLQTFFG